MEKQQGPPYAPTTASLGGVPNNSIDTPITAVFLVLYMCGAVGHMTIFQLNRRRGHKFILSGLMFGFCMSRIATTTLRIAWANRQHNVRLAIAAQIFVQAGVVLLYVINLLFAQRVLRAAHPHFGWKRSFSHLFKALYALIVVFLIMVITVTVIIFYTLNPQTRQTGRRIQLSSQTYYALVSFLPIPFVLFGVLIPRRNNRRVEKFGSGRWRTKIAILLTASAILCLGASFKVGTNYKTPRPLTNPAWYDSKACFYIFNFTVEILVIYLYLLVRVDRRFHVPDGSHGPGDYARGQGHKVVGDAAGADAIGAARGQEGQVGAYRIASEEEVFDLEDPDEVEKPTGGAEDVEKAVPANSH